MKIMYLVSYGDYSDYSVEGVFDSKKKAEEFMEVFCGGSFNEARIETRFLNPKSREISDGLKPYFVRISKEGEIKQCDSKKDTYGFMDATENPISYTIENKLMNLYCMAKDENHAKKIMKEKWSQIIALNKWGKKG